MWMTTQEPSFTRTPSGSQKTPVFVIKTGTFHRNVIWRNYDQLVTGCYSQSEVLVSFQHSIHSKYWWCPHLVIPGMLRPSPQSSLPVTQASAVSLSHSTLV